MNPECNHSFIIMDGLKKCLYCGGTLDCDCKYMDRGFIRDICNFCSDKEKNIKINFFIGD